MKKATALMLTLLLLLSVALAESIDLSSLSFDELVLIVNKAQLEMMKSDRWQEVEVPPGTYLVGQDIPAGKWTISVYDSSYVDFEIGSSIKDNGEIDLIPSINEYKHITLKGKSNFLYEQGDTTSYSLDLKEGWYVVITTGSIIFSPYTGNNFTFK